MRTLLRRLALVLGLLLFAYAVASLDWRGEAPSAAPRLSREVSQGSLRAGAATVDFTPDEPVPLGGFSRRSGDFEGVLDPVFARAVVISAGSLDLGLVSLDLVLVPDTLAAKIEADAKGAGIDRVIVTATHTHSAPGGFWDNALARFGGLGAFDAALEQAIADAAGTALRAARGKLQEVELRVHDGEGPPICRSRIQGRAPDRRLTVLSLSRPQPPAETGEAVASPRGEVFARIVVFACHPTLLGHEDLRLSAGWPGALAAELSGVTLLLQGAQGEVTHGEIPGVPADAPRDQKMRALGQALALGVRALEAGGGDPVESLTLTTADFELPGPSAAGFAPPGLERITSNLLMLFVPRTASLSVLELGDHELLFVPGEVVSPLGARWAREASDRNGKNARVVSLAGGYLGYLETPEALDAQVGESRRAFFGAATIERLETALKAASAVR